MPMKILTHVGTSDWQKAYYELSAYGDTSLPIHALKEGKFIVRIQDV